MEESITLRKATVKRIMDYLATKPYGEVFQLINLIVQETMPKPEKPERNSA